MAAREEAVNARKMGVAKAVAKGAHDVLTGGSAFQALADAANTVADAMNNPETAVAALAEAAKAAKNATDEAMKNAAATIAVVTRPSDSLGSEYAAKDAELKVGDKLLSINDESVTSPTQAVKILKQAEGEVKVVVFRGEVTVGMEVAMEMGVREYNTHPSGSITCTFNKPTKDTKCGINMIKQPGESFVKIGSLGGAGLKEGEQRIGTAWRAALGKGVKVLPVIAKGEPELVVAVESLKTAIVTAAGDYKELIKDPTELDLGSAQIATEGLDKLIDLLA